MDGDLGPFFPAPQLHCLRQMGWQLPGGQDPALQWPQGTTATLKSHAFLMGVVITPRRMSHLTPPRATQVYLPGAWNELGTLSQTRPHPPSCSPLTASSGSLGSSSPVGATQHQEDQASPPHQLCSTEACLQPQVICFTYSGRD